MRQQKQNKAVHHKKRRPPSNRRREKGKKRTARRLFHRVTANSLAACQDETPTAKEKRGGRDLFSQDDVTASRNYMLETSPPLCVCSEIYPAGAAQQENWMLPSSRPEFSSFSLPSGVSSAAENRMKTSAFLFTSIVSLCHIVSYSFQSIQCIVLMRVQPFFFIGTADHFCFCAPRFCVFSNGNSFHQSSENMLTVTIRRQRKQTA